MADILASDLPFEIQSTLSGDEKFVMFDDESGKQATLNTILGYLTEKLIEEGIGTTDEAIDVAARAVIDGTNTTATFWSWYAVAKEYDPTQTRYELLCRFANLVASAWSNKTYGLQGYVTEKNTSGTSALTPMNDLAGKAQGKLVTESSDEVEDWMKEDPMYWYIRANALSLEDGTMNILAFEGEDGFDITGVTAPVYAFSFSLYVRNFDDGNYTYTARRMKSALGFVPYAESIDPEGNFRPITWHACFSGGLITNGNKMTSGAGYQMMSYNSSWVSASTGNTLAKNWNSYEGLMCDCDLIWLHDTWKFRHYDLETSNICDGCLSYSYDYTAAVSETDVKRVLLSASNAANFIVGSAVSIGSSARAASNPIGKVTSITDVTVDGTAYKAVNLDIASTFSTTAGTTHISTMPWHTGATEALQDHIDGALISLTGAKGPIRIQGIELIDGAYNTGLDPLYNITSVTSDGAVYEIWACRDSQKLASSITSDYVKVDTVTVPICNNNPSSGEWIYIKAYSNVSNEALFPSKFQGGSTTFYKSAFGRDGSVGVRCPWRFGGLDLGTAAGGLSYLAGGAGPGRTHWLGRPRLGGAGKKRGVLAA